MRRLICLAITLVFLIGCQSSQLSILEPTIQFTEPSEARSQTAPTIPSSASIPTSTEAADSVVVSPPSLALPAGAYFESFRDDDLKESMDYWYFIPEGAFEGLPLVVYLHGDGNVGLPASVETSGFISFAKEIYGDAFPFIVLQPCTSRYSWIDGNLPQTLMCVIDTIANKYAVDRTRIMITGHSRGAIGTWHLINAYTGVFSAAVPVSCGNQTALDYEQCSQLPVWAFAGNIGADEQRYHEVMSYIVQSLKAHGGSAAMTTLSGFSHGATLAGAYSKETIEWMLDQERSE